MQPLRWPTSPSLVRSNLVSTNAAFTCGVTSGRHACLSEFLVLSYHTDLTPNLTGWSKYIHFHVAGPYIWETDSLNAPFFTFIYFEFSILLNDGNRSQVLLMYTYICLDCYGPTLHSRLSNLLRSHSHFHTHNIHIVMAAGENGNHLLCIDVVTQIYFFMYSFIWSRRSLVDSMSTY